MITTSQLLSPFLLGTILLILICVNCSDPIADYQQMLMKDAELIATANEAMKQANEADTLEEDLTITKESILPLLKKSVELLTQRQPTDPDLQTIHTILIKYREGQLKALEAYLKNPDITHYNQTIHQLEGIYTTYQDHLSHYYDTHGISYSELE